MSCTDETRSTRCDGSQHTWALVLAGGEGSRLRTLTTTAAGVSVPKQFCSLHGGSSLLQDALHRAWQVAPSERTCVVVSAQHRSWWASLAASIPLQNIVVQPSNRGTAIGILLPLLRVLERDEDAMMVVLPSDHYVRDAGLLAAGLQSAVQVAARCDDIVLVGFTPEAADSELGYIVPGPQDAANARAVQEFIEKPCESAARGLIRSGALWNSFIFAVRGQALLKLFEQYFPEIVMEMRGLVSRRADTSLLPELYERLPSLDFSRDLLERCTSRLRVVSVAPCGWNDLGTPGRVAQTLERWVPRAKLHPQPSEVGGFLNLASQYAQLQAAIADSGGIGGQISALAP